MSQSNIIQRERATYIGKETTFGTAPSGSFPEAMTRVFCLDDEIGVEPAEEMLDVSDERVRRADPQMPVHGLQIASKFSLKTYLKATPNAAQLVSGVTAASLTPRVILGHALGTEYAVQGTTCASGWNTTTGDVATGEGSRLREGTWVCITVSGEPEPTKILTITSDTITVHPPLSGSPSNGAVIRQLHNYVPSESHAESVTVRRAWVGDTSAQVQMTGCYGDVSFDFPEFGKLPAMTLSLTGTSVTGPSAQSFSVASATDEMGATFAWKPSIYLAAPGSVARGTRLVCEKASIEFSNTWELVRDGGATQTVVACVNTGGRPRAVKAMVTLRFDSDWKTGFDADTSYRLVIVQKIGTGANASFWIFELPLAKLSAPPKHTKVGERHYLDLELLGLADTACDTTGLSSTDLDLAVAPLRVAFG